MVNQTAQSLRCSANTQEGTQCKFKGIHIVDGHRYCGNHLTQLQGSQPPAPAKEVLKKFGPTNDSMEFAERIVDVVTSSGSKEPSIIVAYLLDGYIANLIRQQAGE
jgi:hypothetical protein